MNTQYFLEALGQVDEDLIVDARAEEPGRLVRPRRRLARTALLAAALSLLLIVGASAIGAQVVQERTRSLFGPQYRYTSLRDLPRAEKLLGYSVLVPEGFSNGYAFREMDINRSDALDAEGAVLYSFYQLEVHYSREGSAELYLSIRPETGMGMRGKDEPTAVSEWEGIALQYDRNTYKIVPEGYQLTDEDRAKQAAGHYYISWGSDQVEIRPVSSVNFRMDGTSYLLLGFLDLGAEEMFQMAGEILDLA